MARSAVNDRIARRPTPEQDLSAAKRRGRILYRASTGSRYTPLLLILFLLSILLVGYHPVYSAISVLLLGAVITNAFFVTEIGITVYERGILIPVSRFRKWRYASQGITYRAFVPYSEVEFFYPCSFKIYRNIIIPNGLTIKTTSTEYHLPHEFARVLSKKLRVALRDEFDKLYKGDFCIYRTAGDWDEVDSRMSEYGSLIGRTMAVYLGIVIGLFAITYAVAHIGEYPFESMDPIVQVIIPLDIAILSIFLVKRLVPQLYRSFYHAIFRTWIALEKGEKVPDRIRKSYRNRVKDKITRQADVLEIFDLDRRARLSRTFIINIVVLIQIMLIFSILPPEVFFGSDPDYSDSGHKFDYKPLSITENVTFEDTELFAHEISTSTSSIVFKNSTVWALGGPLMNITDGASIYAENTRFISPDLDRVFQSTGSINSDHTMEWDLDIPEGARLEYLSEYSIDYGFDFGYVEVITNGGLTRERLGGEETTHHRNDDADIGYKGAPAYTGSKDWFHESISLMDFAGNATIQFHHITDDHRGVPLNNWKLTDIRIVWENGSEILDDDTWHVRGWSVKEVTPDPFWITINGDATFIDCTFSSYGNTELLTLHSADVIIQDCAFTKVQGYVIIGVGSTIEITGTNLSGEAAMYLFDCDLTLTDSIFWCEEFFPFLEDSFLMIRNVQFIQDGTPVDPETFDYRGTTGIAIHKAPIAQFLFMRPDGEVAREVPITVTQVHGDRLITDTTDSGGYFNITFPAGYQFIGTNIPREFFDDHLLLQSDMYRITIGNRTFHRFLGSQDHLEVLGVEGPDLKPVLNSFKQEFDEGSDRINVTFSILNDGLVDATNFSISWSNTELIIYQHNLTVPAGQSIEVNTSMNHSGTLRIRIDNTDIIDEANEVNNLVEVIAYRTYTWVSRITVSGDYYTDTIDTGLSYSINGNLVMENGDLDLSNPSDHDRTIELTGGLFLSNVTDHSNDTMVVYLLPALGTYIEDCTLNGVYLRLEGDAQIHRSAIEDMRSYLDSRLIVRNCDISNMEIRDDQQFSAISNSTLDYVYMKGRNGLIEDCTFSDPNSQTSEAIRFYSAHCYFLNNEITGYEVGLAYEGSYITAQDNTIKDCVLGVWVNHGGSTTFIDDFILHNTFTNCDRQLEYTHDITVEVFTPYGRGLGSWLDDLYRSEQLNHRAYTVIIESGGEVVFNQVLEYSTSFHVSLLQFYISGNGTRIAPIYDVTISADFYGFHHSTFSDVDERLFLQVKEAGDGGVVDLRLQPGSSGAVTLNISVAALGKNISNLKVGVFDDGDKLGTVEFKKVIAGVISQGVYTLPSEAGIRNISARITSKDQDSFNNELSFKLRMITTDEVVAPAALDHTLVVGSGAHLQISGDSLTFLQERDNQIGIFVLGGGRLTMNDLQVGSERQYSIINHGTLTIQESELDDLGDSFPVQLEDATLYGVNGFDTETRTHPYTIILQSGLINYGTMTLESSSIGYGGVYSNNSIEIRETTMTGDYYPSDHPEYRLGDGPDYGLFASGDVLIEGSNLSNYDRGYYLYNADFEIKDSEFQYTYRPSVNLSFPQNWAHLSDGHLILESSGSITDSKYYGASLDIRNSTIDVQSTLFTTTHPSFVRSYVLIMRNVDGTFTNNEIITDHTSSSYEERPLIVLKGSGSLAFENNTFTGKGSGAAMEVYYDVPTIKNNVITNLTYGIQSFGGNLSHWENTFTEIGKSEYAQWYQIEVRPEDGLDHTVYDFSLIFLDEAGGSSSRISSTDSLYDMDYILSRQDATTRASMQFWLRDYSFGNDSRMEEAPYTMIISKEPNQSDNEESLTLNLTGNEVVKTDLQIPELGINMRLMPENIILDRSEEFLVTLYNNGSAPASNIRTYMRIYDSEGRKIDTTDEFTYNLDEDSSTDLSFYWLPDEKEFTIVFTVDFKDAEASSENNTYTISLIAREPDTEDTTRETTFRALTLFFIILGVIIAGSSMIKRSMGERRDAMGINFDAEEFRRSLKNIKTIAEESGDELDDVEWDEGDEYDEYDDELEELPFVEDGPPMAKAPPPLARLVYVPGKDICPECRKKIGPPDSMGITSCAFCGWMKFEKKKDQSISGD